MKTMKFWLHACLFLVVSAWGCTRPDEGPFTIVMLPDTQRYSEAHPEQFHAQTEWICRNVHKENIVFVTQVGDIVNKGAKDMPQWTVADEAMSRLDGVVPWAVAIGNHDYDQSGDANGVAETFVRHFGPQRFQKYAWFGGASANGLNSYQLFRAGGIDFIFLHLEGDIPDEAIAWATDVLRRHPDRAAIVSTHIYLRGREGIGRNTRRGFRKGGNSGEEVFDKFIRVNPQIFMVLCGHEGRTVEYRQISTNDAGGQVLEVLADYQKRSHGGDGWLRIMRFEPAEGVIRVRTYSPTLDQFETDEDSEFTLPLALPVRNE